MFVEGQREARDTGTPKKITANTAGPYSYSQASLQWQGVGAACRLNKLQQLSQKMDNISVNYLKIILCN